MARRLTDKACLQIDLSEKQVRLDRLRAENADLILKSSTELNKLEKRETRNRSTSFKTSIGFRAVSARSSQTFEKSSKT